MASFQAAPLAWTFTHSLPKVPPDVLVLWQQVGSSLRPCRPPWEFNVLLPVLNITTRPRGWPASLQLPWHGHSPTAFPRSPLMSCCSGSKWVEVWACMDPLPLWCDTLAVITELSVQSLQHPHCTRCQPTAVCAQSHAYMCAG
jgi:hypothetical protein